MDWEAFAEGVWEAVSAHAWDAMYEAPDGSGWTAAVGETWAGALYGVEWNAYGQQAVYHFDTVEEQTNWFDNVVAGAAA
ncbi:hypothetical protein [Nocardioides ochotonae]|uniref:hypothetical protein n=1 Tax=Nocardioides ochotonae TaxID=2685869 RepID=UPI00140D4BBF|nr:hypothetical protein [Nocardioides ochotonae]